MKIKCTKCGKPTRYADGICQSCRRTPVTPAPAVVSSNPNQPVSASAVTNPKGGNFMKKVISIILMVFGIIFLVGVILGSGWLMRGCTAIPAAGIIPVITETTTAATTVAIVPTAVPTNIPTAFPAETTAAAVTSADVTIASIDGTKQPGLDIPMETWVFVKAGSLVSADVALYDGDNNNEKSPFYDNEESTADFVYFEADCHIWLEWGGTVFQPEDVNADMIAQFMNKKLVKYPTIRYFSYDGVITSEPVIFTVSVDATQAADATNNFLAN